MNRLQRCMWLCVAAVLLGSCSTTRNLPEGELLYVGQKPIQYKNLTNTAEGQTALEEVEAALATAPNNSFMGSSTYRIPFPMGLWIYNRYAKSEKGFGKWMFNHFSAQPVLLSAVNPDIRAKAASNVMRDYGFFNGTVGYETLIDKKDSLKVRLQYAVDMKNPYFIDTLYYKGFSERTSRIMERSRRRSLVHAGEQFNVVNLDAERTRITTLLRNVGCYYFRSDYMTYQADTTLVPGGHVSLRLVPIDGMPKVAEKPFYLGRRSVYLYENNKQRQELTDSVMYKDLTIHYDQQLKVRPNILYRWIDYKNFRMKRQITDSTGLARRQAMQGLYSLHRQSRVQERLSNAGIFNYLEMKYTPRDTTFVGDTLDVSITAVLDKPYDAELDFDLKLKSNNQMGPGASYTVTKNNVFGGGESWKVALEGSYEWQTGKNRTSVMDSYELGVSTSLVFPRVIFPKLGKREYDFPATTTFKLYANQLNRAKYYKLLAFGGNATYEFQPRTTDTYSFTPFKLTFNVLSHETAEFRELQEENPALYVSLRNQFIPAMEYTYTYDNSKIRRVKRPIWWQTTFASAGNLTSLGYALAGKSFSEEGKELLGVPYAQFLKVNSEFRYHHPIDKNQSLAARMAAGAIWSYGNATSAPYTEQFYIGGANSVRAFSVRSVGPGGYPPDDGNKYSFINHVGDMRFEANLEYRFRIVNDLHGAAFLDAGNVWLMREDESRPSAKFSLKDMPRQLAVGTGVGLRYDMDFLVFRLDCGIGIHAPYETGKSGYYNIPAFKDGLALHFAIGYPF